MFALRDLEKAIDKKWASVLEKLEAMRDALVNRNALLCNVTVDAPNWDVFKPQLGSFLSGAAGKGR
ncbi:MAG: hypothetical protein M0C28_28870 [Candidatus Moduliflexus flocculans]|nr:hypothetical protein [Candidatus Moduliflexus flocculans]